MNDIGELAVCMCHVPEHPDHAPDPSRTKDFDARWVGVGWVRVVWNWLWNAEDVSEKSEGTHCMVGYETSACSNNRPPKDVDERCHCISETRGGANSTPFAQHEAKEGVVIDK